jgi:hypothetical protein
LSDSTGAALDLYQSLSFIAGVGMSEADALAEEYNRNLAKYPSPYDEKTKTIDFTSPRYRCGAELRNMIINLQVPRVN